VERLLIFGGSRQKKWIKNDDGLSYTHRARVTTDPCRVQCRVHPNRIK